VRKSIESLLVWFVPVALLGFAAGSIGFALSDREARAAVATVFGWSTVQLTIYIKFSQSLLWAASNIVVAVWLGNQQHPSLGKRTLWSLFGLVSGLWAVGIWLLAMLTGREVASDS
jgi:hypothetical protein